jgi:DNA adenine methylase
MWSQLSLPFVEPAPIIKWVGGKGRLLSQLLQLLPKGVDSMRHLEPFVGGAALFFARRPSRAVLCDTNPHLCAMYEAVRDRVDDVIAHLRELATHHDVELYYHRRERYNREQLTADERAALFVYLNKTGFNGLHRVNRSGQFNVSAGRYDKPGILDEGLLRAASQELASAELRCESFERVLEHAGAGDFVYLDPPYVPVSRTSNFTGYSADGFTLNDQTRLRDVFLELDRRGCKLMLTNSDSDAVRALYAGYVIDVVSAPRSINCATSKRGPVNELVVRNYDA